MRTNGFGALITGILLFMYRWGPIQYCDIYIYVYLCVCTRLYIEDVGRFGHDNL